jgi:hypothetical protein
MASRSKPPKGFPALRRALTDRTHWSPQVLSQRVRKQKKRMPMKTGVAQAIIAHDQGIRIDRYLVGTDLKEVQDTLARVGNDAPTASAPASNGKGRHTARAKRPGTRAMSFKALNITITDPFLAPEKIVQAHEMAKVYPVLHVLENSIRNVIRKVMEAQFGTDWWDTALTSPPALKMKNRVENRLKTEAEQSWHQRRGDHKIDYIDLSDLLVIAQSKPNLFFPGVLGKESWFQSLVDQTSPSRHVLCHMNGLKENSVTALGVRLVEWENHLKNRETEIRAAMSPTP